MQLYHYFPGKLPVILSIPHAGTYVPDSIKERFTPSAQKLPDTDWHVEKLYSFAHQLGIHILTATHSRYVIDLNRSPDGQSLYPGQFTTGLCPTTLFDSMPLYKKGQEITAIEIQERIHTYWQPYHSKLQSLIDALKTHRQMVLFDAHSIRSQVPTLFTGILPDLNMGTADGQSADLPLVEQLLTYCKKSAYSVVCNGRFKGGYITRHYGNPLQGRQAIQLELTQKKYMQEDEPYVYHDDKAIKLQEVLRGLLSLIINWVEY